MPNNSAPLWYFIYRRIEDDGLYCLHFAMGSTGAENVWILNYHRSQFHYRLTTLSTFYKITCFTAFSHGCISRMRRTLLRVCSTVRHDSGTSLSYSTRLLPRGVRNCSALYSTFHHLVPYHRHHLPQPTLRDFRLAQVEL